VTAMASPGHPAHGWYELPHGKQRSSQWTPLAHAPCPAGRSGPSPSLDFEVTQHLADRRRAVSAITTRSFHTVCRIIAHSENPGSPCDVPYLIMEFTRVMVYTFARVNAVIAMKVKDYFVQGQR
jgi:hypothetical protein